jgi:hypothetical protein
MQFVSCWRFLVVTVSCLFYTSHFSLTGTSLEKKVLQFCSKFLLQFSIGVSPDLESAFWVTSKYDCKKMCSQKYELKRGFDVMTFNYHSLHLIINFLVRRFNRAPDLTLIYVDSCPILTPYSEIYLVVRRQTLHIRSCTSLRVCFLLYE